MCRSRREAKIHPRPRRGCKVCLKPGSHIGPAMAAGRETRRGETRRVVRGRSDGAAGRCAVRGNSRSQPPGAVEGASARGNPRAYRRHCRKMRCAGNRGRIKRRRGRGDAGQPGDSWTAMPKDGDSRRFEAPSPVQRKMQDAGNRGRIGKLNGKMFDPSNLWFIAIEASEIPESLAPLFFVSWFTNVRVPQVPRIWGPGFA
jgi:hypothetical protein